MVLVQFVCNQCQGTVTVCIHYDVSLPQRIGLPFINSSQQAKMEKYIPDMSRHTIYREEAVSLKGYFFKKLFQEIRQVENYSKIPIQTKLTNHSLREAPFNFQGGHGSWVG